jgi:hypothetical protein
MIAWKTPGMEFSTIAKKSKKYIKEMQNTGH